SRSREIVSAIHCGVLSPFVCSAHGPCASRNQRLNQVASRAKGWRTLSCVQGCESAARSSSYIEKFPAVRYAANDGIDCQRDLRQLSLNSECHTLVFAIQ